MAAPAFIPCTVKKLPADLIIPAAETARAVNPANAPSVRRVIQIVRDVMGLPAEVDDEAIVRPQHIAVLTTKYWGAGGVRLTVGFMEKTVPELQAKIVAYMNKWQRTANVTFTAIDSPQNADVRISRGAGGYYSYLGSDIKHIPRGEQTMNLEQFTLKTPDAEYNRVVTHETGHCFAGDTLIDCPRDLKQYPQGIPIKDLVGQTPWVYAWKDGTLVIRKASRVWLSRKQAAVVRVRLKPGRGPKSRAYLPPQELVGTPEHRVLLADGVTWKELGSLQPGDRLCSMYRQSNGERSRIRWTNGPDRVREHVFVCEQVHGERPAGHDCHHRNERKMDQSVENLEWKLEADHHSDHGKGRRDSEETRRRRSAASAGRKHTDEAKAKMSAARTGRVASEETRAKMSAASKGKAQSPELVAKRAEAMRRFYAAGGRSGMYGKTASEETRAKRSASMKATLARKKLAVANHTVVSVEHVPPCDVYDMTVPNAESFVANGVVVHNCLGCPHEHMRAALVQLLDRQKTIAYFRQSQGWSAQEVEQQVLTALDERSLMATPPDQDSVMCYQLPGEITTTGQPIRGGAGINASDAAFMAKIYPRADAPPDPPTPPQPPSPPPASGTEISLKIIGTELHVKGTGLTVYRA